MFLKYSQICTSRVDVLPSGLFFPPSVVSGEDEVNTTEAPVIEEEVEQDCCHVGSCQSSVFWPGSRKLPNLHSFENGEACLMERLCVSDCFVSGGSCLTSCLTSCQFVLQSTGVTHEHTLTGLKVLFCLNHHWSTLTPRILQTRPPRLGKCVKSKRNVSEIQPPSHHWVSVLQRFFSNWNYFIMWLKFKI